MIILAIGAHPDDLEICCGGMLTRFRQRNDIVVMAYLCQGDKSGRPEKGMAIHEIRKKEADGAAKIIGARSISLGFKDSEIVAGLNLRRAVVDLVRLVKPQLVITHPSFDYHSDHRVTSQVVTDAVYIASSHGFRTKNTPLSHIPTLYYQESFTGIGFQPTEYVNITDVIKQKIAMVRCHRSQSEPLKKRGGMDILEMVLDVAKFRGWQSGVKYAEAFQACPIWPNLKTERILP